MPLPFDKALIYVAVKHKLDSFIVLNELFRCFPIYVFDNPPLSYVQKRLEEMIVPKSILSGKYDSRTLMSFWKKMELLELEEIWQDAAFEDLLYDSDLRRTIDIMAMCGLRQTDMCVVAKAKIATLTDQHIHVYVDAFASFGSMSFIEKKNFVYNYVNDPVHQRLYMKCLENRSIDYIKSVLNIATQTVDPTTLVNRAASIASIKLGEVLVNGDMREINESIKLQLRIAETLQKLGAGNQSAAEELAKILSGENPNPPVKAYTLSELLALRAQQAAADS